MNLKPIFITTVVQTLIASTLIIIGQITLQPLPYALGIGLCLGVFIQLITLTLCNTYSSKFKNTSKVS